jgi:hypothetical protein
MNPILTTCLGTAALAVALAAAPVARAQSDAGRGESALRHAASVNKTLYLVFYRDWGATAAMAKAVKEHADRHAERATWNAVRVTDAAEKGVVDRFQVSRAPMPLTVAIHPNGAITGAFVKPPTSVELAGSLVSPKNAECVRLLQQNKLVILCVKSSADQAVPKGASDFQADPQFAQRTTTVTALLGDAAERGFVQALKLDPQARAPVTVLFAPPGVIVGAFPASATHREIAAALHKAGKCCSDPNCKHNH